MSENDKDQSNEFQIGIIDEPNPRGGIDTLEIKKPADAKDISKKYLVLAHPSSMPLDLIKKYLLFL